MLISITPSEIGLGFKVCASLLRLTIPKAVFSGVFADTNVARPSTIFTSLPKSNPRK
jgi:hypothetical protein